MEILWKMTTRHVFLRSMIFTKTDESLCNWTRVSHYMLTDWLRVGELHSRVTLKVSSYIQIIMYIFIEKKKKKEKMFKTSLNCKQKQGTVRVNKK